MVTLLADQLLQQTLEDRNVSSPYEQLTSAERPAEKKFDESGPVQFRSPFKEPLSIQLCPQSDERIGDALSPGYASQAVSPTQVAPAAKRHRRSASIPGDTISESPRQRRAGHSRLRMSLVRPSVVRPDVFMAESNHSFTSPSSGSTSPSVAFVFSGSTFAHSRNSSSKLLNSESVDSCMLDFALTTSEVSDELTNIYAESKDNNLPLLNVDLPQRCHSQPSTSLSRVSSLKRRRDEECFRPRIDFLKMRETAFVKSESTSCAQTCDKPTFLSSEKFYSCLQSYSHNRQHHCACDVQKNCKVEDTARSKHRCTDSWSNAPCPGNTVTAEPARGLEFADDWPLLKQSPGYSSSDDDETGNAEVCKKPLLRFTGCGSADDESSVDSFGGDLDLDLIENN